MTGNPDQSHPPTASLGADSGEKIVSPPSIEQIPSSDAKTIPAGRRDSLSEEAQEELKNLSISLQKSRLQANRMENFAYEPVSLPASRVPSNASQNQAQSGVASSRPTQPVAGIHSPPLTPSASGSKEDHKPSGGPGNHRQEQSPVTPNVSPPREQPPTSVQQHNQQPAYAESRPSAAAQARLPRSSQARPRSAVEASGAVPSHPRQAGNFVIGATGDSLPASSEGSPAATPGSVTPTEGQSPHDRPYSPAADRGDQYARAKRPSQSKIAETADHRFGLGGAKERPRSPLMAPGAGFPRQNDTDSSAKPEPKRHSLFGSSRHGHHEGKHGHEHHASMSDLKRFFKFGGHKKEKRDRSPAPSRQHRSGTATPPSRENSIAMPFAEDHGLESKYGKFGKVLGSGAGGSVRIMKRQSDGTTFAVKQFRDRHSYESEKEYNKKVTAEFCIGSTLHHGNIIETMDIVHEKGKWYEVMEYAPYDLFAIVMTGKMSREEISCCTLQILNGVVYLHSMGLAHRDLKLDNVVVNERGIMKIIDFGSAAVFRYPFENDIVLASGIVGSDPYLAPEVYDQPKYDPRPTDVWSLAIMFCCMTLRRFPWKAPRLSDNSYKMFVTEPTEEERRMSGYPQAIQSEPPSRRESEVNDDEKPHHHHSHHAKSHDDGPKSEPPTRGNAADSSSQSVASSTTASAGSTSQQQAPVIKGPWRLLRLLPRETRQIIGKMLEIDPQKRATLDEILRDPWVQKTPVCRQEEGGQVINVKSHTHTLEPSSSQGPAESKNK